MNSLLHPLEHWASVFPDRTLSRFLDLDGNVRSSYSYAEFADATRNLAEHLLLHSGLRYGDRALLIFPPGLEMMVAFFACARAGIIPVPAPAPSSTNLATALVKMAFIAENCGGRVVLTTREFHQSAARSAASARQL